MLWGLWFTLFCAVLMMALNERAEQDAEKMRLHRKDKDDD